jgi:outer membrane protein insertion porin family
MFIGAFVAAFGQGEPVGEVVVRGLKNVPESTVLATMRTKAGQIYQPSQLTRDKQSIEALGFFQDVRVYGQLMQDNKWRVVVEVVEWPIVSSFKITGNTVFPTNTIIAELEKAGIKTGGVFSIAQLDKAARAVSDLYRGKGYFARINKFEPGVDDPSVLNVEIVEARVNKITVNGLTRTKRSVINRLFDTKEGDLLNQRTWTDDLRRVFDTRWFDSIKPDTREPEVGKVDLILDVQEGRTGTFNVGLQLDPRNQLAGFVSVADSNFRGTGQSIGANLVQSAQSLGTSLTLDYGNPFFDRRRSSLNVSLYSRQSLVFGSSGLLGGGGFGGGFDPDNPFSQRRTGANVSLSRVMGRQSRGTLGLRAEHIDTINFVPDPGEEFIVQDGEIASLTLGFLRNRRDNNLDPSRGDWIKLQAEPSFSHITSVGGLVSGFDILGSNYYTRLTLDVRKYWSPGPPRKPDDFDAPRQVIAGRLFSGAILGETPFSEQFFIGGANGVRGYAEDRYWGRYAVLAQLEFRQPIQRSFNAVAFVDYGGAWDGYPTVRDLTQTISPNLHVGYGVGVNFKTAFGPIRLDFGFDDNGKFRTHFQIGGSF